jgi:hypothetical protein
MGGRDIIITAAFLHFTTRSRTWPFDSLQNAGFALPHGKSYSVAFNDGADIAGGLSYLIGRL